MLHDHDSDNSGLNPGEKHPPAGSHDPGGKRSSLPEDREQQVQRLIAEYTQEGASLNDENGNFLYANPALETLLDSTSEQLINSNVERLVHPEDLEHFGIEFDRCVEQKESRQVEARLRKQDGTYLTVEFNLHRVQLDAMPGAVVLILYRDVSAVARLRTDLKAALGKFNQSFDLAPHGMAVLDRAGQFLQVNSALCSMFGYSSDDLSNFDLRSLIEAESTPGGDERITKVLAGELASVTVEQACVRQDGTMFNPLLLLSSIPGIGERPQQFVLHAIHEESSSEADTPRIEQSRLRAASTLAGGFAHEINNLISVIQGNAALLQRQPEELDSARDRLWTIEQASRRVTRLADNLIAMTRAKVQDARPMQVNTLLDEMLVIYNRFLPKRVELEPVLRAAPDIVRADSASLQLAVMHLVQHVVNALGERSGSVYVSTSNEIRRVLNLNGSKRPRSRSYIAVSVRNDREDLTKDAEKPSPGSELGQMSGDDVDNLATVRDLADALNGNLEIETEPGLGSTFRLLLPAEDVAIVIDPEVQIEEKSGKGTILVVDDEKGVRELLATLLSSVGFSVIEAENGRVAMEHVKRRNGKIDLVLLDLLMPELDGNATFELLHESHPGLPVIIVSGFDDDEHIAALLNKGARTFIQKPFELDHLLHEVSAALNPDLK